MTGNGGVIRRRFNTMTSDEQDRIKIALKQTSYRSNEKDALAWIIFGLVIAVTCAVAAAMEANWKEFNHYLQSGSWLHAFFGGENIIVTGFIVSVIAVIAIAEYWRRIHGRFGYVALDDSFVRVRGQRVAIIPFENIVRAKWVHVKTHVETIRDVTWDERNFSVLELHLADGKTFNFYASINTSAIQDKFVDTKSTFSANTSDHKEK